MRQVIARYTAKAAIILAGILIVSTCLQLMIRFQGAESIISIIGGQMSEAYPGQNEILRKQTVDYVHELMGLDRQFAPDLWPFDNESLWSKSESASR